MRTLFCGIVIFLSLHGFAQNTYPKEDLSESVLYTSEKSYGLIIHTRGWGLNYRYAKNKNASDKKLYELEFATQRHPKEKKLSSFDKSARSFVYGKLNSVISVRGGIGWQKKLYRKDVPGSVEIRYSFIGGPSLAFAKPVYLEITSTSPVTQESFIHIEKYDPLKHNLDNIIGRAPVGRGGLSRTKISPGVYGKFALQFEYSDEEDYLKFIETGVVLDAYLLEVPQMASVKQNHLMFALYVSFNFGSKMY